MHETVIRTIIAEMRGPNGCVIVVLSSIRGRQSHMRLYVSVNKAKQRFYLLLLLFITFFSKHLSSTRPSLIWRLKVDKLTLHGHTILACIHESPILATISFTVLRMYDLYFETMFFTYVFSSSSRTRLFDSSSCGTSAKICATPHEIYRSHNKVKTTRMKK